MLEEEKQDDDLKAFEAALAALQPRADGLDPRWRFLLAQEAALNHNLSGGDALAAGPFVCSRCGAVSSGGRGKRRWAWPAAFSAMTAVAAALLLALVVRIEPRAVTPGGHEGVSPAPTPFVQKQSDSRSSFAISDSPRRAVLAASDEATYLSLRDQVLRFGIDSWRPPVTTVAATTKAAEPILGTRGHLDRLLKREAL